MKKTQLLLALIGAVFSLSAFATNTCQPFQLNHVSLMRAGGYWTIKGKEGLYRVVVIAKGRLHVGNTTIVQVLTYNPKTRHSRVRHCAVLQAPGSSGNIVKDITIRMLKDNKVKVTLQTRVRDTKNAVTLSAYIVDPNGKVVKSKP